MPDQTFFTNEFARALMEPDRRPDLFEGTQARIEAGLDVYRNNVMFSLTTALSEIYPVVRALVGEDFFSGLARVYIRAEPPVSAVLAEYGRSFPEFLENFEQARQARYLPDVARLERASLDAWHAADATPLSVESLAALPPESYASATFACHPSLGWVASPWPVCTIWEAHQREGEIPEIDLGQGSEEMLIVRPGIEVRVWRVPPGTAAFLQVLRQGEPLATAVDATLTGEPGFDLGRVMAILLDAGAFTSFRIETTMKMKGEVE